jgi:hypothetical protein
MKIRIAVLASLVAIAATSIAGCGGDDDKGTSKQDYIAKADAICHEADKQQGAGGVYGDNFSNAAFLTRHNAVTRDALKRLRALEAPDADRKEVDAVLTGLQGTVTAIDKQIAALRARDLPKQSEASREFEAAYGSVVAAAGAFGLSRCQSLAN